MQSIPSLPSQPYGLASLIVNILIAIGTIGAVVVALFGEWTRFKLFPPSLEIQLIDPQGEGPFPSWDKTTMGRWYHLRVSNHRKWYPLTNADVRLIKVEVRGIDDDWQTEWAGDAPINCRDQQFNPWKHTIGSPVDFDICSVRKNGNLRLHPIVASNNLQVVWTGETHLRLSCQARSIAGESPIVRIEINWDGGWEDGETEMMRHFRIREA